MEPTSVIFPPNILPSDINNLIVFALIALLVLWSIRIFRNSCQLLELSRSIALQAIFRLDIPNESTLSPREYFEQLLRRRQQAKSPPSSVQYVLNPVNIDKSSIQLSPIESEKLEEEAVGRYSLKFSFDALYPCNVRLYWGVPKSELDRKLFGEAPRKKKAKKKRSSDNDDGVIADGEVVEGTEDDEDDEEEGEPSNEARPKEEQDHEEEEEELLRNAGDKKKKSVWIEMISAPFSSLIRSMDSEDGAEEEGDIEANGGSMRRFNNLGGDNEQEKRSYVVSNCYANSPSLHFEAGMKQSFETPINAQLVLNSRDEQDFSFAFESATSERYPLLIELSLANSASVIQQQQQQQSSLKVIVSQFTIAQFTKVSDDPETYRTSVVNQFFEDNSEVDAKDEKEGGENSSRLNGKLCEYKDVYGIFDSEPDCVVCLCEPKAATILPCRHFCVCFSCMLKLDKCPVCRTKIKSYMRFYLSDEEQQLLHSPSSSSTYDKEL